MKGVRGLLFPTKTRGKKKWASASKSPRPAGTGRGGTNRKINSFWRAVRRMEKPQSLSWGGGGQGEGLLRRICKRDCGGGYCSGESKGGVGDAFYKKAGQKHGVHKTESGASSKLRSCKLVQVAKKRRGIHGRRRGHGYAAATGKKSQGQHATLAGKAKSWSNGKAPVAGQSKKKQRG